MVETRAADRDAESFPHSSAPFPPKFKEEWVERHVLHDALRGPKTARTKVATHFSSSSGVARGLVLFQSSEEEPGGGLAGACGAARHGGPRNCLPVRADSRSSCAVDGGLRGGRLADSGSPDGRVGYRSAQDLLLSVSFSFSYS